MKRTGDRKFRSRQVLAIAAACTCLFSVSSASANQGFNLADRFNNAIEAVQEGIDIIWPGDLDSENVNARLGVGFGWTPDYMGSDSYRFRVLPIIDFRYKEVWRLNGSKFTYSAFRHGNFETGPLLNLHFGRSESNNQFLTGLGDINTTLDVGMFARLKTKTMLLEADVRQALGAGQGMAIRFTAGHGLYQKGNFVAGAGIRARYMSKKAMQTNFGITQEQSDNSLYNFAPFQAKAGVSEVSANVIGAWRLTDKVRLLGLVSVGHLFGSAAASPLSSGAAGSDLQFIAGTGLTFQF